MNYGTIAAQDIFGKAMDDTIARLDGMLHIRDGFMVTGKDNTHHDRALENLLQRFRECGLTFNPKKRKFRLPQIEFFGFVFSTDGMKPSPTNVKAMKQMDSPKNVSEGLSLSLGYGPVLHKIYPQLRRDEHAPAQSSPTKEQNEVGPAQSKQHLTNSRTHYLVTLSPGTLKQDWKQSSLWMLAPMVLDQFSCKGNQKVESS